MEHVMLKDQLMPHCVTKHLGNVCHVRKMSSMTNAQNAHLEISPSPTVTKVRITIYKDIQTKN